jgi:cysteine desulfurase/selenocysteine lyase
MRYAKLRKITSCLSTGEETGTLQKNQAQNPKNASTPVQPLVLLKQFPLIDNERSSKRTYLDNAASTQKPQEVIEAISHFYENSYSNVHRGIHKLSSEATEAFESARFALGRFIKAPYPEEEIIFCKGATEAINLVAHAWGDKNLFPGDEVVLTTMEHHSNLVPWQMLCNRTGARLVELKPTGEGIITEEAMERAVGPRTKLLGITHVSNVLGTINDVKRTSEIAHRHGALVLVDGAQALGHMPVDVPSIGCDLYAGSGHKMFGPSGTGFLFGHKELLETFDPFLGGGEMIEEVDFYRSTYAGLPAKLEAGTPNIAGMVGLGAAVSFLEKTGMEQVRRHDEALIDQAMEQLTELSWLEIYGPRNKGIRSGLISFNIKGIHAHDAGTLLDSFGVAVRTGHMCAQPLLRYLDLNSCVRASFALYNGSSDVERLVEALIRTAEYFGVR